jgi:ribose-phosphate pyrophosphokinase
MSAAVFAFVEDEAPAQRLAAALGAPFHPIHHHHFPDEESLVTVSGNHERVVLFRRLDRPDAKVMPLRLAADALRRAGATRVLLAVPYLPYLRQDELFAPGQSLSRDVFGAVVGPAFDMIVTVEPHLHRTHDLTQVFAGTRVIALSAAELFARSIGRRGRPLIVGPDAESEPWTVAVAAALATDHVVFTKHRSGDAEVSLGLPATADIAGRRVVLVDDICSSGATLLAAIDALRARGASSVEILVAHALFSSAVEADLRAAGARRIVSTDSCDHPTNDLQLAGLLAGALQEEITP